jgi:hypothetical protein
MTLFKKLMIILLIKALIIIFVLLHLAEHTPLKPIVTKNNNQERIESYKKKHKIGNISACIFYGRKIYTEILLRYLDSNLKINGGILDKILILNHLQSEKVNMTMESDYLYNYLSTHREGYELVEFKDRVSFKRLYSVLPDDDLIFKIDDDVVFIANGTFERMVDEYFKNDHFILSANVINHHSFSVLHAKMGLMQQYNIENNHTLVLKNDKSKSVKSQTDKCLSDFRSWRVDPYCGAIAHESFFYNIYKNNFNLNPYNFSLFDINKDGYHQWRINFIAFRGKIAKKMVFLYLNETSDEYILTVLIAKSYNRHAFALGSSVVSHFSYSTHGQLQLLSKTEILDKYKKLSIDYFKTKT